MWLLPTCFRHVIFHLQLCPVPCPQRLAEQRLTGTVPGGRTVRSRSTAQIPGRVPLTHGAAASGPERVALCIPCSNTDAGEVWGRTTRCKAAESVPAKALGALGKRRRLQQRPPRARQRRHRACASRQHVRQRCHRACASRCQHVHQCRHRACASRQHTCTSVVTAHAPAVPSSPRMRQPVSARAPASSPCPAASCRARPPPPTGALGRGPVCPAHPPSLS